MKKLEKIKEFEKYEIANCEKKLLNGGQKIPSTNDICAEITTTCQENCMDSDTDYFKDGEWYYSSSVDTILDCE